MSETRKQIGWRQLSNGEHIAVGTAYQWAWDDETREPWKDSVSRQVIVVGLHDDSRDMTTRLLYRIPVYEGEDILGMEFLPLEQSTEYFALTPGQQLVPLGKHLTFEAADEETTRRGIECVWIHSADSLRELRSSIDKVLPR